MVYEDFNCWLTEVNSSPDLEYTTNVTERLVKMVTEDTIKVVIDHRFAPKNLKDKVDTGKFSCIYGSPNQLDR